VARHHLLPAIRAGLLCRLGRMAEARAYDVALDLVGDDVERSFLLWRSARL
jgi:RNA polymerase sigma-70 factor, ECF subfamily